MDVVHRIEKGSCALQGASARAVGNEVPMEAVGKTEESVLTQMGLLKGAVKN